MPLLHGVGVGPGDPELLTIRAARILRSVPVVFHPAAGGEGEGMALGIVRQHLPATVRVVALPCMSGGGEDAVRRGWRANAEMVADALGEDGEGAFVTEGDPLLYSTFQHLLGALAEVAPQVRVEIVPGVSSVTAAAAAARFPLVRGAERLAVLPASRTLADAPEELLDALRTYDALVLLKVARVFDRLLPVLREAGCSMALVERCGLPGERIVLDPFALAGQHLDYFSILLVRRRPA